MAKDKYFNTSSTKFQESLSRYIENKFGKVSEDISNKMANAFVKRAKQTLIENATPYKEKSADIVRKLSKHISKTKKDGRVAVRVNPDREGLYMFLEYGTGLVGASNPHPQAKRIGWKYAKNQDRYETIDNKFGFIYNYNPIRYIDAEDKFIVKVYSGVKKYVSKKTGETKVYGPYDNYRRTVKILSSGLKPVRYIYNTRVKMNRLIRNSKNVKELKRGLKQF